MASVVGSSNMEQGMSKKHQYMYMFLVETENKSNCCLCRYIEALGGDVTGEVGACFMSDILER